MTGKNYLFTSPRIGFRNWDEEDLHPMTEINQDAEVMTFFPSTQDDQQTHDFIVRMKTQFAEKGFCYFAAELLADNEFIGFIGLSIQSFESDFTPCIDIGWRLKRSVWNHGLATEGARQCLNFAFDILQLDKVYAMCPALNHPSENVMKKIGMNKIRNFQHPKIPNDSNLRECVLYEISNPNLNVPQE